MLTAILYCSLVMTIVSCSMNDNPVNPDPGADFKAMLQSLNWGNDTCFVYGHKTPDVDAVTSALSYAKLMNVLGYNCKAKVSSPMNRETQYIAKHFGFALPELKTSVVPQTRLILTDHTDYSQCVDGAREAIILQKIDHHVEGDIADADIPYVRREMVGSVNTIIYESYKELGVNIDNETARIMLAGIVSDTRNLSKSTTTSIDSIAWLALTTQLGITKDSMEVINRNMENAAYDYSGMTDDEILLSDYKDYEINGYLIGFGSLACKQTEMDAFITRMLAAMPEVMKQKGRQMLFAKIDNLVPNTGSDKDVKPYVEGGTYFIYYGEDTKRVAEAIFGTSLREGVCYTSENLVRKQIVPRITEVIQVINEKMAAVRDYVPLYAVIAHRGSTYWTPEETESAWRWAREIGADYLESDLQCSKDGVIIANHDDNLKRTTNIEEVFGSTIPSTRMQFYESLGFSHEDALEQYQRDQVSFRPYYMQSYYYAELLMLDAGKWFGETFAASRNGSFIDGSIRYSTGQYVSALQDQIAYADGRMLHRKDDGERILPYHIKPEYQGKTLHDIWQTIAAKGTYKDFYMDFLDYDFTNAYVTDPQDTGHRPGIYIEFKEPDLNPDNMEQRVYDILDREGWNIITKPATETAFYVNGKVNVGRTNGKVILQTFSNDALCRANAIFQGRVPMCYLLWINNPPLPGDFALTTPEGFAQAIQYALANGAHIIGPSIAGEPNNYDELNASWQAQLTRRMGMLNHPYSFDTLLQMSNYVSTTAGSIAADGCFTNRSELSLQYMIDNGFRCRSDISNPFHTGCTYDNSQATSIVPDAVKTLERLGYSK